MKNEFEHIRPKTDERTCISCGAPVTTEFCPFCGKATGLDTATAVIPDELDCIEAHLDFWGTFFPLIFALSFGYAGFGFPFIFWNQISEQPSIGFMFIPFMAVGIGATIVFVRNIWAYLSVKLFGHPIEGVVYGYANDTVYYNDIPGQVCKLRVSTREGYKFIMYQLKSVKKPYAVNTTIPLKVYKNRFMITKKQNYDLWE